MQDWLGLQTWYSLLIYVLLILFFTFFYTKMQINPEKLVKILGNLVLIFQVLDQEQKLRTT